MASAPTVISAGQRIDGLVQASEDVVVEGTISGSVDSDHSLIIEESGILDGDAAVRVLVVRGVVVGNIRATDDVVIAATGQVQGDITARRMELQAGGRISGNVETGAALPRSDRRKRSSTREWSAAALRSTVVAPRQDEVAAPEPEVAKPKPKPKRKKSTKAGKKKPVTRSSSNRAKATAPTVADDEVVEIDAVEIEA